MAITALIARVSEAESAVSELRRRHDPSAAQGVPAHVTVLFPFKDPAALSAGDLGELERIVGSHPAFSFTLGAIQRWPHTTALIPDPAAPFIELTQAIVHAFPDHPPYAGRHAGVVPHLTVADGSADSAALAEAELRARLLDHGPILARCRTIELIENGTGAWRRMHVFRLDADDA